MILFGDGARCGFVGSHGVFFSRRLRPVVARYNCIGYACMVSDLPFYVDIFVGDIMLIELHRRNRPRNVRGAVGKPARDWLGPDAISVEK